MERNNFEAVNNKVSPLSEVDALEDGMKTGFGPGTSGTVNGEAMECNSISNSSHKARCRLLNALSMYERCKRFIITGIKVWYGMRADQNNIIPL